MKSTIIIAAIPFIIWATVVVSPNLAISIVSDIKKKYRLYLINHYGNKAFQKFAANFKKSAKKQGLSVEHADHILEAHKTEIIKKLGTKVADERLGEPSTFDL